MSNPNLKLIIKATNPSDNLVQFILYKGAQLDASIITPKRLIELHDEIWEEPTLDERVQSQALKGVMGECSKDITGTCTLKEAVELLRALNHKQEAKLVLYECVND